MSCMVHRGPHSMMVGLNTVVVKKRERGQEAKNPKIVE